MGFKFSIKVLCIPVVAKLLLVIELIASVSLQQPVILLVPFKMWLYFYPSGIFIFCLGFTVHYICIYRWRGPLALVEQFTGIDFMWNKIANLSCLGSQKDFCSSFSFSDERVRLCRSIMSKSDFKELDEDCYFNSRWHICSFKLVNVT